MPSEIYNELVMDDPADAQSYLRISQIYRQQRDFTKAREANDKAKAIEPNSIEIRYNEVNILEAEDRITEATKLLKDILDSTAKRKLQPGRARNRVALLERLAGLYRSMDQTDPAIDAYRQIGRRRPHTCPAFLGASHRHLSHWQGIRQGPAGSRRRHQKMARRPHDPHDPGFPAG